MSKHIIVDCHTGKTVEADLTANESAQREKDIAEHKQRIQERDQQEAVRDQVMGKLATAAGVDVEDVKLALGAGRRKEPKLNRPK